MDWLGWRRLDCALLGGFTWNPLRLAGAAEHKMEAEPRGLRGCREARKELGKSRREVFNLGLRCFSTHKAGVGALPTCRCLISKVGLRRGGDGDQGET